MLRDWAVIAVIRSTLDRPTAVAMLRPVADLIEGKVLITACNVSENDMVIHYSLASGPGNGNRAGLP
jgi:hypothetical protein